MKAYQRISVLLPILAMAFCGSVLAQVAPTWTHVNQIGNTGSLTEVFNTLTDAAGNVYQTGSFTRTTQAGTLSLTLGSGASFDMFLVKYDPQGNVLWMRQAGSQTVTTPPNNTLFGGASGRALAVDAAGNVYVAGIFRGGVTFGSLATTLAAGQTGQNCFLAKYSPQGTVLWTRAGLVATPNNDVEPLSVSSAPNGDVFVAGGFSGTATFGPTSYMSQGSTDVFLAKYSATGSLAWVQVPGSPFTDLGFCVKSTPNNGAYLTGSFTNTLSLSAAVGTVGYGQKDGFLAYYDNQGTAQWIQAVGGPQDDEISRVEIMPTGELYAAGSFQGTSAFGGLSLTSAGGYDGFLLKCTAQGVPQWARRLGGTGNDYAYELVQQPAGPVYLAGNFEGTAQFDTQSVTSAGASDVFLARYNASGSLVWLTRGGGVMNEYVGGLSYGPGGTLSLGVKLRGPAQFGTLTVVTASAIEGLLCQLQDNTPLPVRAATIPEELSVYPNPMVKQLTVAFDSGNGGMAQFYLYDALGKVVRQTAQTVARQARFDLPVADLPPGIYTLKVVGPTTSWTRKVMKEQ